MQIYALLVQQTYGYFLWFFFITFVKKGFVDWFWQVRHRSTGSALQVSVYISMASSHCAYISLCLHPYINMLWSTGSLVLLGWLCIRYLCTLFNNELVQVLWQYEDDTCPILHRQYSLVCFSLRLKYIYRILNIKHFRLFLHRFHMRIVGTWY